MVHTYMSVFTCLYGAHTRVCSCVCACVHMASLEAQGLGVCMCVDGRECVDERETNRKICFKDLAHTILEAKKLHSLLSVS